MSDSSKVPPKCVYCPYWEYVEPPYICNDCKRKVDAKEEEKDK